MRAAAPTGAGTRRRPSGLGRPGGWSGADATGPAPEVLVRLGRRTFVLYVRVDVRADGAERWGTADTAPVGDHPATGGRVKQYADGAERAREWRERQRTRRAGIPQDTPAPSPGLAEASLSASLDRFGELVAAHQAAIAGEVARVEDAIGALADPEAVA